MDLDKIINNNVIRYIILTIVLVLSLILISGGDDVSDILVALVNVVLSYGIGVKTNGTGQETGINSTTE